MHITYSECGFVALVIEHAMRMRHIILPGCKIFSDYLINVTIFEKKKKNENKLCVLVFSKLV